MPENIGELSAAYSQNMIRYSTATFVTSQLPDKLDAQVVEQRLKKRSHKYCVKARVGDLTELESWALTWWLVEYGSGRSYGRQYRQILRLDPDRADQVGQVILTYTETGDGTAIMVGRGLPMQQISDVADGELINQLQATYQLGEISGKWRERELLKVSHALALMDKKERIALRGVTLKRVQKLESMDDDRITGRFTQRAGPFEGSWGDLTVADAAFSEDAKGFVGGDGGPAWPPSFQTILHEVGHAIESITRRQASRRLAEHVLSETTAPADKPLPHDEIVAAVNLKKGLVKACEEALETADRAIEAVRDKLFSTSSTLDPDACIAACEAKGGQMAQLAAALKKADSITTLNAVCGPIKDKLDEQWSILEEAYEDVRKLADKVASATPWTVRRENLTAVTQKLAGLDRAPWKDLHEDLLRWCGLREKAVDWYDTYRAGDEFTTGRLNAFRDHIKSHPEDMDLTDYTKRQESASELYAESYGYWRVDPGELGAHSAQLLDYFHNGRHLTGD